jgi:hypothetical protein
MPSVSPPQLRALARRACALSLLGLLALPEVATAQVPAVTPLFPCNQTLVPGGLPFGPVDLGRSGHTDWRNGTLCSAYGVPDHIVVQ